MRAQFVHVHRGDPMFGFFSAALPGKSDAVWPSSPKPRKIEVEARQSRAKKFSQLRLRSRRRRNRLFLALHTVNIFRSAVGCSMSRSLRPCGNCCRDDPAAHSVRPPRKDARAANRRDRGTLRREENRAPLGVEPPESATANRPARATASPARATNCSAPWRASSAASAANDDFRFRHRIETPRNRRRRAARSARSARPARESAERRSV